MKVLKYISLLAFIMIVPSCKDASLSPYVNPIAGVAAYGTLASGSFTKNEATSKVNLGVNWVSVDKVLTVNKIELYVIFKEDYIDKDGNPATADFTAGVGKTDASLILAGLANRQVGTITITGAQVYNLYKDATFKYDGKTATPVFNNPATPRPAGARFTVNDHFAVKWKLYTADGQVFGSWSPSICTGTVGYNCEVDWDPK